MPNLILLEDEPILRKEVAEYLRECGYGVDETDSIEAFYSVFQPGHHHIALLDLGLPDGDGLNLITSLRRRGETVGIIVLTARSTGRQKVEGLLTGADHYFSKPVELDELAAAIAALFRRLDRNEIDTSWVLDTLSCQLIPPAKAPIQLTAQAYIVLKTIVQGKGKPVDRRKIVEALGENYLQYDLRRLDTQIYQLRKTVEVASNLELPLQTQRGRGYRITARFNLK
jgi:DNA-binding response OmpR family regulator